MIVKTSKYTIERKRKAKYCPLLCPYVYTKNCPKLPAHAIIILEKQKIIIKVLACV